MLETFAEVTTVFTLYTLLTFTDIMEAKVRYEYGWIFIAIISVYIAVHLYLLVKDTYFKIRYQIRKRMYIRRMKIRK